VQQRFNLRAVLSVGTLWRTSEIVVAKVITPNDAME
jgi:hypothetical protein